MNNDKTLYGTFAFSFLFTILGAMMKIMHWENANFILGIGLFTLAFYTFLCLYEIFQSTAINKNEKIMWLFGFLFFTAISGLVYVTLGRERIVRSRLTKRKL